MGWVILPLMAFFNAEYANAGEWPQILGPNRDGQASNQASLDSNWDASFFSKPAWTVRVGSGYAGAVIAENKAFLFHRQNRSEILQAVDSSTGKSLWQTSWVSSYQSTMNPDSGPRCAPVVDNGKIVCYGAGGDLACVDAAAGKLLWNKPLRRDFQADDGYFGAGSTPLVVDGIVIVNVGGKRGGIVGIDLQTGTLKWSVTDYEASYSSPIVTTVNGKEAALVVTRLQAVLLDVLTGKALSEVRFGSRGPTVNAATPIRVANDQYFLTASYGVGATLLDVATSKMSEIYRDSTVLSSQYNTPVMVGKRLIGIDGREDIGQASLRAIDPLTREVVWEKSGVGVAHLIAVGQQVLAINIAGQVRLIDGSAEKYKELAAGSLPNGTYRALPALSNSRLIVRRSDDGDSGEFLCYRLPTVP